MTTPEGYKLNLRGCEMNKNMFKYNTWLCVLCCKSPPCLVRCCKSINQDVFEPRGYVRNWMRPDVLCCALISFLGLHHSGMEDMHSVHSHVNAQLALKLWVRQRWAHCWQSHELTPPKWLRCQRWTTRLSWSPGCQHRGSAANRAVEKQNILYFYSVVLFHSFLLFLNILPAIFAFWLEHAVEKQTGMWGKRSGWHEKKRGSGQI